MNGQGEFSLKTTSSVPSHDNSEDKAEVLRFSIPPWESALRQRVVWTEGYFCPICCILFCEGYKLPGKYFETICVFHIHLHTTFTKKVLLDSFQK